MTASFYDIYVNRNHLIDPRLISSKATHLPWKWELRINVVSIFERGSHSHYASINHSLYLYVFNLSISKSFIIQYKLIWYSLYIRLQWRFLFGQLSKYINLLKYGECVKRCSKDLKKKHNKVFVFNEGCRNILYYFRNRLKLIRTNSKRSEKYEYDTLEYLFHTGQKEH